jgi:flagellar biosynthesis GTPase FlhF
VLNDNPIPFKDNDRKYHGTFDICVEMVSDSSSKEIKRDTVTKFGEYEAAGVKEYWLLSYDKAILGFYRLNKWGKYEKVKPKNGVWESEVLPGFRVRVDDLFRTPPLSELVDDPVYADFVFPKYQQERDRADSAEHHAEQERNRADSAEHHAEQERFEKEQERNRADSAEHRADQERFEKEQERNRADSAEHRAEREQRAKIEAEHRAEKLAEFLRKHGFNPDVL